MQEIYRALARLTRTDLTVMITGDNPLTAASIAAEAGVDVQAVLAAAGDFAHLPEGLPIDGRAHAHLRRLRGEDRSKTGSLRHRGVEFGRDKNRGSAAHERQRIHALAVAPNEPGLALHLGLSPWLAMTLRTRRALHWAVMSRLTR